MATAAQLEQTLRGLDANSWANASEREKARNALYAAFRRVQTPWDVGLEHTWTAPTSTAIIKVLIDAGFWRKWVTAGGQPDNSQSLGKSTGFDPVLLKRYLRMLAGEKYVTETDVDTFALTPFTRALAEDKFPSLYTFLYELNSPCFANYPKFAAETNYINDTDPEFNNFNHWKGKDQTMFTLLAAASPEILNHHKNAMTVYSLAKTAWVDVFPTDRILTATAAKSDRVLVVDVGGGNGHDLEMFRAKHPNVPEGSLVVQDLPQVIESTKVQIPCVAQGYDFYTPQPIKGARVYYFHCILHDWDDVFAVKILKNTASAMEKGFSRILLHENVIVPFKAHARTTLSDLVMYMSVGGLERELAQWESVIAKAGLKLVKIWTKPESVESIIELELP